jgi:hypothetical protein
MTPAAASGDIPERWRSRPLALPLRASPRVGGFDCNIPRLRGKGLGIPAVLVNTFVGVVLIGVSISDRPTRPRPRWWAGLAVLPLLAALYWLRMCSAKTVTVAMASAVGTPIAPQAEPSARCSCFRSGS